MKSIILGGKSIPSNIHLTDIQQSEVIHEFELHGTQAMERSAFWVGRKSADQWSTKYVPTSEIPNIIEQDCIKSFLLSGDIPKPKSKVQYNLSVLDKIPLLSHQQERICRFLRDHIMLDGSPMGTGKSLVAIGAALVLIESKIIPGAVVITRSGLELNFLNEIRKHIQSVSSIIVHGSPKERLSLYKSYAMLPTKFLILSWDIMKQDYHILKELLSPMMLVCDETGKIKNQNQYYQILSQLWHPEYMIFLNGTPFEMRLSDLYNQIHFLDPHLFSGFNNFVKWNRKQQLPDKQEFQRRLKTVVVRQAKKELLPDLPEKYQQVIFCPLEKKQRYEYNRVAQSCIATERLKNLTGLRKLSDIYNGQSGKWESVKDICGKYHKIIIFSFFKEPLEFLSQNLKEAFPNAFIFSITGSTQSKKRVSVIKQFEEYSGKAILLSTHALSHGYNMAFVDAVIHFDEWWNPARDEQMSDRAWRKGRTKELYVFKLISQGTIEESIIKRVDSIEEFSDWFVGQKYEKIRLTPETAEAFLFGKSLNMCSNPEKC